MKSKAPTELKSDCFEKQSFSAIRFGNETLAPIKSVLTFPDASTLVGTYWEKVQQCQTPEAISSLMDKEFPSDSLCNALEAQYKVLDKNGKTFVGLLTHELSGHCTLVRHAMWNLDEEPLSLLESQKLMKNTLEGLVKTIQIYERFYAENKMTSQSPFQSVFQEALDRVKPLADQKRIELVVENTLPPNSTLLVSDFRTDAMVWNLVQNAIKYSPVGSKVTLSLLPKETPKGAGLEFKVTDSGIGILPTDQEKVLMGYRGKNAEQAGIPGTGFGLSEVEKHTRYAHGELHIQSPVNPENTQFPGTCITVTLPVSSSK